MARYSVGLNRAGVNSANTVLAELRAASTARIKLLEVGISVAVAPTTAPRLVLGRPTNTPVGGTNNVPVADDAGDGASLSTFFTTGWSTTPTFSTSGPWARVLDLPVTVGANVLWTFPEGFWMALSGSVVLANLNASGATLGSFDMYFMWDE
jgi:hypothetical protein